MILPPLNLELSLSQEFLLQQMTSELEHAQHLKHKDLVPIILSLTRQLMIQKNVTADLIKTITTA